ncbi:ABC transporter permease [Mucilaginibacter jinjuensis]|uniref:ABC transporter permease n=1 Tax=Mucilaginibacter jinjuensis TaxID=1176721 RepID=A0ABY7T3U3_9SPHI|nr:ABC transporter permease [Mucilaginibacter jinjuensis]WCT10959.1 ABC transporter permease [Mucilaginibacter jinjuensis]
MFRNLFKTAWRNIFNNKFYTFINIAGLTIGLVIGLFILLWVQDELSFDRFNKQADNIYKIGIVGGTGPTRQIFNNIIAPVVPFAKNEIPDVKDGFRINNAGETPIKYKDQVFLEKQLAFTDPAFFSMLDFHLIDGNAKKPFPDNNSVVITQSTAKKYFGNAEPVGKVITIDKFSFTVTGIIKDGPTNSSFNYKLLAPIGFYNHIVYVAHTTAYNDVRVPSMDADWGQFNFETYLLLKPGADIHLLEKNLQRIHERQKPDDAPVPYLAQPLLQMHLYKADGTDNGISTVRIFALVALLILIVASINYVNLSTARSILRAKEVSMRKIIGASKMQLFMQFIVETTLLFMMASILAITIMYLLLPAFNDFSGKQLTLNISNYHIWECIGTALIATLAASSIYPALLLSSFEPLKALKGKITASISNVGFRRVLVIVQFTVSIVLIIGTLIIGNQLKYIRNKNLGYDKENTLSFNIREDMVKHYDAIRADLLKQPGVLAVARSGNNIVHYDSWTGDNDWEGKPVNSNLLFHPVVTDQNFIPFFKMKIASGRNFSGLAADSMNYIINEAAAKAMGLKDPVGKQMRVWKNKGTIIGVVKDFHFNSLRQKIEPLVMLYDPKQAWRVYIKTTGKDASNAIIAAQKIWKKYNTQQVPISYAFLDDDYNKLYNTEQHTASLFNLFSAITITLSCLGLFGLATYTAQVKTREIGIRKVFGASIVRIVALLATEFMLLVVIALFIAVPVSWYAMNKWLLDFAYRTNIQWWLFAVAGVGAIAIAFITISVQSIKAALANPTKSLRNE